MAGKDINIIDIHIREFIPEKNQEDHNVLLPAFLAIWNAPENLRFLSFTQIPFKEPTVVGWFSNHQNLGGHYYAATEKDNSEISGIAAVRINLIEGFEIIGIGVRPESKRQGIATKLIEHTLFVAKDHNFKAVEAGVLTDNVAMLRLLLSMSFVPVRMDYNRRCDGQDTLHMKKIL